MKKNSKYTAMLIINCSQTIASISPVLNTCPFEVPKSGKFIFRKKTGGTSLLIATTGGGSVALSATWTTLLAAVDETKAIATPKVTGINVPSVEIPKTDSGSSNGVQRARTVIPAVSLSGKLFGVHPSVIAELQELTQLSLALMDDTELEVFIVDEKNNIFCLKNGTAATGIPCYNVEFTSTSIEDGEDFTNYMVKFDLAHGWDKTLEKVACSFSTMAIIKN